MTRLETTMATLLSLAIVAKPTALLNPAMHDDAFENVGGVVSVLSVVSHVTCKAVCATSVSTPPRSVTTSVGVNVKSGRHTLGSPLHAASDGCTHASHKSVGSVLASSQVSRPRTRPSPQMPVQRLGSPTHVNAAS